MKLLNRLFVLIVLLGALSRCANIQTPSGGPKDKRPPKLISSVPRPNDTNFHGTSILLTFDEAVKLKSPRDEIIISPSAGKDIEFTVKGNKVFITPKAKLQDSTTYNFQFREGIQDITEGNAPLNLKLAFSTGPTIDSLSIAGEVHEVLTGTHKEKITVAIFSADTFDIFKHTPNYFTQTDKQGNFRLNNLRAGRYHIYAFADGNKNLKVESRSEKFGFLKDSINLTANIDTLSMGIVQLDSRPLKISSIRNIGNVTRVRFSKELKDYELSSETALVNAFGDNHSEINIWNPPLPDSLKITLVGVDSLINRKDTVFYIKTTDIKPVKEKFNWSLGRPAINPENAKLLTTFTFSKPLSKLNFDSLYVKVDTTELIPITREDMTFDEKHKEINVVKDFPKKMFGADQNPLLTLMAKSTFAVSIDGDTTKQQSASVGIYWPEENGTLTLQANTHAENYILQLLEKTSGKVILQTINLPRMLAKNIPPGDYYIRVIIDKNANGIWDAGNYYQRIEPENVIYFVGTEGSRTIPVRANWEIGPLQFTF